MIYDMLERAVRKASAANKRGDFLLQRKLQQLDRGQKCVQRELWQMRQTKSGMAEYLAAHKRTPVVGAEPGNSAPEVRREKLSKRRSDGATCPKVRPTMSEGMTTAHQNKSKESSDGRTHPEVETTMPESKATDGQSGTSETVTSAICSRFVRRHSVVPLSSHDANTWSSREFPRPKGMPGVTTELRPVQDNLRFVRRHSMVPPISQDANTWSSRDAPRNKDTPNVMTKPGPVQDNPRLLRSTPEPSKTRRASIATVEELRTSSPKLHQDLVTKAHITGTFRQFGHTSIGMAIQNRARQHSVAFGSNRRHSVSANNARRVCTMNNRPMATAHRECGARKNEPADFEDAALAFRTKMLPDLKKENGESSGRALRSPNSRRHSTASVLGKY